MVFNRLLSLMLVIGFLVTSNAFGIQITLVQDDIVTQEFDDPEHSAIVNPANERLIGGSGVAFIIQRACGDKFVEALKAIPLKTENGVDIRCEVGGARAMQSFNLKKKNENYAHWVLNAVGPDVKGKINRSISRKKQAKNKKDLLIKACRNTLDKAEKKDITTVAFTAISTGIFGYDIEEATPVQVKAVLRYLKKHQNFDEIRFVVYSDEHYEVYKEVLDGLVKKEKLAAVKVSNNKKNKETKKRCYSF